jgi:hypothetical protein
MCAKPRLQSVRLRPMYAPLYHVHKCNITNYPTHSQGLLFFHAETFGCLYVWFRMCMFSQVFVPTSRKGEGSSHLPRSNYNCSMLAMPAHYVSFLPLMRARICVLACNVRSGIPWLFQRMLESNSSHFMGVVCISITQHDLMTSYSFIPLLLLAQPYYQPQVRRMVYSMAQEGDIAELLAKASVLLNCVVKCLTPVLRECSSLPLLFVFSLS